MGRTKGIEIDGAELRRRIKEKYKSEAAFSKESGIPHTSVNEYCNGRNIQTATLKLICLLLECTEEDLQKKAEPKTVATATNILLGEEIRQTYEKLLKEVLALRDEMVTLSKFTVDINKKVNEIHGQEQLNAEEMQKIHSKMAEINGNFSKVYAKMSHKY